LSSILFTYIDDARSNTNQIIAAYSDSHYTKLSNNRHKKIWRLWFVQ